MAVAESLIEYTKSEKASTSKENPNEGEENKYKGGSGKPSRGNEGKGKEHGGDKRDKLKPKTNCFLCNGPHWARECPKRQALNALIQEKEVEEAQVGPAHVGSLQLLNAIKSEPTVKTHGDKGLMFVDVCLNGKPTRAMVDTGATHNFVSAEEAKRLGLRTTLESGWLKAVNSGPKPLQGTARGVNIQVGLWSGKTDLTVVSMDDYQVVIGMDFLSKAKAVPLPFLRSMVILDGGTPCMVQATSGNGSATPTLSAMQVLEGSRKDSMLDKVDLGDPGGTSKKKTRRGRRGNRWGRVSRPAEFSREIFKLPEHSREWRKHRELSRVP